MGTTLAENIILLLERMNEATVESTVKVTCKVLSNEAEFQGYLQARPRRD